MRHIIIRKKMQKVVPKTGVQINSDRITAATIVMITPTGSNCHPDETTFSNVMPERCFRDSIISLGMGSGGTSALVIKKTLSAVTPTPIVTRKSFDKFCPKTM